MNRKNPLLDKWSLEQAADLYGIKNWGAGYFDISSSGDVLVNPKGEPGLAGASLREIVEGLRERGWDMPVLLRFEDILASRLRLINESFAKAINEYGYKGKFRGVYPIKVNQQQQVVEEVTTFGKQFHHGLEAGSKAELITAMSYLDDPESLLICNGYKDAEFINLALSARRLGINCVIVIETMMELPLIIERSKAMGVEPLIGVRLKLSSSGSGHWKSSGGDRSAFGLSTNQIIQVVDELRKAGMLDCLRLMHYHLGSQVPNIRDVRNSVVEAVRTYAGLVKEGAPMGFLDLGGGLAVDYDGSATNFASSCNYTIGEYARDIVEVVMTILNEDEIAHPTLITESGRATVAYYSVLIFNVLDVSRFAPSSKLPELPEDAHDYSKHILHAAKSLTRKNMQEVFHDSLYYRDEIRELFKYGKVSIRERGQVEGIFWALTQKIAEMLKHEKYVPDEFESLNVAIADTYHSNLSVFQSLPDIWAIDQLFPVMPIHRLAEAPTRQAVIADITCDCDGKIDRFIDLQDVKNTLTLHELEEDKDYYLGVFLVGAYQETLGDLHNLLGDTHVASVRVDEKGKFEIRSEIEGDSIADVLEYVEYDPKEVASRFRRRAENAVRDGHISSRERKQIMEIYLRNLNGYTYYQS
ncbi:MAG: biosynthetic arginine decarboxylase [Verrucomicrobiota bacterium JB022]|nr:biosynthetic arginine decarboxylase [Verrucomicrobiota bacterium JB022]